MFLSRIASLLLLIFLTVPSTFWAQGTDDRQPNFLFVLVDDQPFDAIGFHQRYPFLETPNIDRLAKEGAHVANFFVTQSVCSPSRASFLTGTYPHIHGVNQNNRFVDPDWNRFAPYSVHLQQAGYETAHIGKIHMAHKKGEAHIRPGFDYWYSFLGQGKYTDPMVNDNGQEYQEEGYMTDILTDKTVQWLTEKRDPSKPFCLNLWHKAVHEPHTPAPRHKTTFQGEPLPPPPHDTHKETFKGKPRWQRRKKYGFKFKKGQEIPDELPEKKWPIRKFQFMNLLRSLKAVDESLGTVLATLEEMGELENTVIIYSSDNGYFMGEHTFWDKRIAYENSMRVPMIVRYPTMIPAGSIVEPICLNIDLAPTILDLAGIVKPDYMQGKSMNALLRGESDEEWRKAFLFEYYRDDAYPFAGPTQVAVRTDRYKLVNAFLKNDIDELYDLQADPGEMTNLILDPSYDAIEEELRATEQKLKQEYRYNPDRDWWLRTIIPKKNQPQNNQQKSDSRIQGKVINQETGAAMPGVTVHLKGSTTGALTGSDGGFGLNAQQGDTLVFSFLGMESQELAVRESPMTVSMATSVLELDEVEIVSYGYYDVNKRDLTGSVAQVNAEVLEKNRVNFVEQMLQGQVAGVVVSENSEPGAGIGISIRGTNSMLGGTQPLYVIDGIPVDPLSDAQGNNSTGQQHNSLSFLNPNDIDKIEILKDASASAIYGARGANGVVIITTKGGDKTNGKDRLNVNVDLTMSDVIKQIDVLDGPGFEQYMNQRFLNQLYQDITDPNRSGMVYDGTQSLVPDNFPELADFQLPYAESTGVDTRWQDQTYRRAYTKHYTLSYRTGSKDRNLSMSLGLLDNQGVIINSNFQRFTYNMNIRRNAWGENIKILSKSNASYKKGNSASVGNGQIFQQRSVVSQALQFQPIFGLLELGEDDDIYADLNEGNIVSNPYTLARFVEDRKEAFTLLQSLSVIANLSSRLSATIKGSVNYQRSTRDNYYPTNTTRGRRNNGEATQAFLQNLKVYSEASLRYKRQFRGKHRLNAIAVGTVEHNDIRSMYNKAFGFGSDLTSFYNFQSATDVLVPISQFREVGLLSGLARVGYNYKWKYYIDANARIDASSKFAANNKSAVFPSVALAWVPSREPFLQNSRQISFLKFRFSYGKTGSNPIAPYQSLALLAPIRYNFDNTIATGFYEANLANDDLSWETTDQYNGGIDLRMFKNKVSITFDAYYKKTHDLLQLVNLPASNGYATRVDNFGEVDNKGVELSIKGQLLDKEDIAWEIMGNIGINRNELVELNSNLEFQLGPSVGFSQANPSMFMEGMPLGIFWGAETEGIYSDWEEAFASGIEGAAPGEIKYVNHSVDLDELGNPLPLQQINFEDYVQIGDPNPDFTAAITNNISIKNWDLSFLFTGQKGGEIFWVDAWQMTGLSKTTNVLNQAFQDSWKAPLALSSGEVTYDPSIAHTSDAKHPAAIIDISARAIVSDRQVYDGSFIKLKNVNLGYTVHLPGSGSLRLYASGRNVIVWTRFPGYDPEIQTYYKNPQRRGIDFGSYPGSKSYVFGIKFTY
ncbi:MAG: SusC/RagA family TonB-linked outer membrane protein [Bacteroidota bacterium]